jgi:hypothetical protein
MELDFECENWGLARTRASVGPAKVKTRTPELAKISDLVTPVWGIRDIAL